MFLNLENEYTWYALPSTVNIEAAVTRAFDENWSAGRELHHRSWPHTADDLTVLTRSAKHSKRGGGHHGRQTLLPLAARVDVSPHGHNPAASAHKTTTWGRGEERGKHCADSHQEIKHSGTVRTQT